MKKKLFIFTMLIISITSCGSRQDEFKERLNYFNTKYMFRLTFPESWLNYSTFEIEEIIDPEIRVTTICFTLPTRSREWQPFDTPNGYAALFYIRIFTPDQWDMFFSRYGTNLKEINSADRKIAEKEGAVFMIKNSTAVPVDLYLYVKDIPSITDTFRVVVRE